MEKICGADRLGHGVRIVEDITVEDGVARLGRLAAYVRDAQIPLDYLRKCLKRARPLVRARLATKSATRQRRSR